MCGSIHQDDTTYAFVSNSISALIWFNSFGLMNQGSILVTLVSFFPSPRVFVPEKNPSSLLFAVVWFVPAVVTEIFRAQLSFSFLSVVGISVYFGIRSSFSCGITDRYLPRQRIVDLVALGLVVTAFLTAKPLLKGHPLEPQKVLEMKIYPSFQPLSPAKTSIDGIPSMLSRQNYVETSTLRFIVRELGWLPLANFTGSACAPIVRMFYSNIIEHDLDQSYLQSSLFGIVVKVTPKIIAEVLGIPLVQAPSVSDLEITSDLLDRVSIDLWGEVRGQLGSGVHTGSLSRPAWVLATFLSFSVYPSSHRANICKNGCILLSRILHREPINLASCILDEMIFRGDPTVSKKEVLPFGILITQICQRAGVVFL
ncbi:hypothetical protein CK203_069980 [Vitis vinifera]|uniref:Putative plant transposon protein domain-containing protein n=1 Tax=Vitis vinifera TaxID=29760 RepID=A0A438EPW2_VITVI|nr:hypothetical protein CK203_069980 [Vitis vinifera]